MIISITGGCGFIGKYLVEKHLQLGDQVRVLSRRKLLSKNGVKFFVGDLSDPGCDFSDFVDGTNILYHCAGELNDETLMQELHVYGSQRLVDAAQGRVGRWVQLSSVGAYGACRNCVVTEDSPEYPSGVYEQTKTDSDEIVRKSGIPYVILRPSNVFGSTMINTSLFQLVKIIRKGLFFYIGKEGALVNYVHVDDVVRALVCCGKDERALNNIYNLSQTTSIEKMVESFLSGLDIKRKPLRLPERPIRKMVTVFSGLPGFVLTISRIDALTGHCFYDSSKIRENLDFEFPSSLESKFVNFASNLTL
ncbi:NAD(P)-dependent oxidoreductase [Deltaproteobacteria bacterium]|nr:NAD(P)-dependent oxidoreductase [Deltaproteobacteria bacterium]